MFEGKAEEAMIFYVSLFPGATITDIVRYGANEAGAEGSVMKATFSIGSLEVMCIMSLFVDCGSEEEIAHLTSALSSDGNTLMPLGEYGFSRKFAWVSDRFGVSWQVNLA
jgi:predicted 3-demethylubiquinone-9 3-methyltransferase (glyoxalase superfamily)